MWCNKVWEGYQNSGENTGGTTTSRKRNMGHREGGNRKKREQVGEG